jgi:hypothetical protein
VKVTTGGISVGVGTLIVGALSVAGVLTVRDENNTSDPDGSTGCQPQPHDVAVAASEALAEKRSGSSGGETSPFTGTVVMPSDQARDLLGPGKKAGTLTDSLPDWTEEGYVVVVDYNRATDGQGVSSCFEDTPILYLESRDHRAG